MTTRIYCEWRFSDYITTINSVENNSLVPASYGPKPGGPDAVAPMSKARAGVLGRLRKTEGTLSVEQLSLQTGQHANTVREHLEALVDGGYATKTAAPKEGRGRPAWLYSPAAADPVGYAGLAAALAQHLALTSEDPAAEGEAAGRAWARAMPAVGPGPVSGVASAKATSSKVVVALEQAGFGVQKNRNGRELTLTRCPIIEAARENPEVVCAVHLGLVKELVVGSGLSEDQIMLEPFAGPGICSLQMPEDAVDTNTTTEASLEFS